MKRATLLALYAVVLIFTATALFAQKTDLSGTWSGDTLVPDSVDKDKLTLVLRANGTSYSGTITDSMGMANQAALERVKFEKETLTFEFVVAAGGGENVRISVTLKVSGEKLAGSWVSEDGATGALEMVRKK